MILDSLLAFEPLAGTTYTTGAANLSANIVDIGIGLQTTTNPNGVAIPGTAAGAGARDLGIGDDPALKLLVEIVGAPTGGTSIQVSLQGAPDSAGAPGAFTTYVTGFAVPTASLLVGAHLLDIDIPRPPPGVALPRYFQLLYNITGTFSPGITLRAYIVLDRDDQIKSVAGFPSGYVPGVTIPN